jgi:hypothetical protein
MAAAYASTDPTVFSYRAQMKPMLWGGLILVMGSLGSCLVQPRGGGHEEPSSDSGNPVTPAQDLWVGRVDEIWEPGLIDDVGPERGDDVGPERGDDVGPERGNDIAEDSFMEVEDAFIEDTAPEPVEPLNCVDHCPGMLAAGCEYPADNGVCALICANISKEECAGEFADFSECVGADGKWTCIEGQIGGGTATIAVPSDVDCYGLYNVLLECVQEHTESP